MDETNGDKNKTKVQTKSANTDRLVFSTKDDEKEKKTEEVKEEIGELRIKYRVSTEKRDGLGKTRNIYRNLLRSNPSMTSRIFKDAWEDLKKNTEGDQEEQGDL